MADIVYKCWECGFPNDNTESTTNPNICKPCMTERAPKHIVDKISHYRQEIDKLQNNSLRDRIAKELEYMKTLPRSSGLLSLNGREICDGMRAERSLLDNSIQKGVIEYKDGCFWFIPHTGTIRKTLYQIMDLRLNRCDLVIL